MRTADKGTVLHFRVPARVTVSATMVAIHQRGLVGLTVGIDEITLVALTSDASKTIPRTGVEHTLSFQVTTRAETHA